MSIRVFIILRCARLLIPLFLVFWAHFAYAQSSISGFPFVRTFPTVEYNAGIQNWSITQDQRGILYVANNFGLLQYDGVRWETFRVKNGTKVRSVAIDASGRIFVGCQADFGYFFPNKSGLLQYTSLADSLPPESRNFDEAWSTYIDGDKIYFCTFSRIYIYQKGKFEIISSQLPLDISFLVNRELFVNVRGRGLSRLQGNALKLVPGGEFFHDFSLSSILSLGNGDLLVATFQEGVYRLSNGIVHEWNNDLTSMFRRTGINCLLRLRNGSFAAGTQNNGLLVLDDQGKITLTLTRGKGLESRTILGLYEDDEGNLWTGQNNGIAAVELGSPFTFINEQSGLPGTGYAAYFDGRALYLGTNTGLYVSEGAADRSFRAVGNTAGQAYFIGRLRNELLLGHHRGAFKIGNESAHISHEPGSWIFMPLRSHPDVMLEGTYIGLQAYRYEGGQWKLQKKLAGFHESSRVMAEDDRGFIWVTHGYKGAYRIKLNERADSILEVRHYGKDNGFPSDLLINVFRVRNELVFSSEAGLYRYNAEHDTFEKDPFFTKLLGDDAQVWNMQEDAFGNIYITGSSHMGVLRKNAIGQYTFEADAFNRIRRFLNDDLVNVTILANNEVLFGAKDGFIHYDPARKVQPNRDFRALIRNVTAPAKRDSVLFFGTFHSGGMVTDQQPEQNDVVLPHELNSLTFAFSSTGLGNNAGKQYQFYLEKFEDGWSSWSDQTVKEYTNLKEGDYVFHVRARNNSGVVSQEATFRFSIRPPWYRSVVAYFVYTFVGLSLLFLGFNLLDRKYQREQKQLEEEQQQKLDEKANEIKVISSRSKEEISRLQHEKLEADLRHMNSELATATMHLLNKNEFISGIRTHLNSIAKRLPSEDGRKEILQITRDIDNNISGDQDWEHFQFHFDRVHGDFTHRFKAAFPPLSPQDIKLSAYLRMNLSTKEIAQLLNISVRGVEISRYRLRKKLKLDRNQNLQEFILNF